MMLCSKLLYARYAPALEVRCDKEELVVVVVVDVDVLECLRFWSRVCGHVGGESENGRTDRSSRARVFELERIEKKEIKTSTMFGSQGSMS